VSEPRRIRVIGQQRKQPDLKALARAVIELARLLDEQPGEGSGTNGETEK
jgi:hypothetical protein